MVIIAWAGIFLPVEKVNQNPKIASMRTNGILGMSVIRKIGINERKRQIRKTFNLPYLSAILPMTAES